MAVFFLVVVVTCSCAGIFLAKSGYLQPARKVVGGVRETSAERRAQIDKNKPILAGATVVCVIFSYLAAYRPGWAYEYLRGGREA